MMNDIAAALEVRKAGEGDRKSGTTVRVWPDAKYFDSPHLPLAEPDSGLNHAAALGLAFLAVLIGWGLGSGLGFAVAVAIDRQPFLQRGLLPLAAVFDLAENLLQLHLLAGPVGTRSLLIPLSALFSTLKWGLAAGFAGVVGWRMARKWTQIGRLSR